jgi:hypothetical protein
MEILIVVKYVCAYGGVVVNGVTQATSIISSDEASLSIMHVDDAAAIYLFFSLPQLISRSF